MENTRVLSTHVCGGDTVDEEVPEVDARTRGMSQSTGGRKPVKVRGEVREGARRPRPRTEVRDTLESFHLETKDVTLWTLGVGGPVGRVGW